jgi:hypothetical protein
MLNGSEGWEIPRQPRLNWSINFTMGSVTSRDQQIQNMARHQAKRAFSAANAGGVPSPPACLVPNVQE